jgi:hypothetical protein
MTSSERQGAGSAALAASVLLALSLGCTLLAVRWFTLPNLLGFSGQDVLAERDFWCVLGSVAFALGASVVSFRHALVGTRPASGSVIGAALAGVGVAFLLFFLWWHHLLYYAVLLAPAHALALLGVALSWGRHQRDAALERSGFRSSATEPSPRTRSANRR